MSIVYVREIWSGRQGSIDHFGIRRYTRVFLVQMTDSAGPLEATNTSLIPGLRARYITANNEIDLGATCRSITPKQVEDNPFLWTVTCEYSSERTRAKRFSSDPNANRGGGTNQGDQSEQNPWQDAPDISWGVTKFQVPITKDADGKAVVSRNGERFSPPVMMDDSRFTLTITKKQQSYDQTLAYQFLDTVNLSNWIFNIPAGTAKCDEISAQSIVDRNQWLWRVRYVFHIRTQNLSSTPWELDLLSVGTYQLVNNKPVSLRDPTTGAIVTSAVPLDANGAPLSLVPPVTYDYSHFRLYSRADFNLLRLP